MIEKVTLKYFKRFREDSFRLKDAVVLAGQNNAGKTTLLQAIATWHFAFREWQKKRGASSARQRTSVALTRKEFLSVPVQAFKLLWTDTQTALTKEEGGGRGAATPRIMQITLEGKNIEGNPWTHTMEFRYANSELLYAKPSDPSKSPDDISKVVYIPSFSGIEIEEKVHTPEYQEWLIGQGKPGDIIRNLLVETCQKEKAWERLSSDVEEIFGYRILKPQYEGRPFILCEYLPGIPKKRGYGGYPRLEIANAGSGFLQTLLLLAFFYARPSTVLLIDEPDAHMHIILQKQIYDHLRTIASERNCQILVATHSEVLIDNTDPSKIISFYGGKPHQLVHDTERDGIREALKRLKSQDIALAEQGKVLYVEGSSDFSILHAWAKILDHPLTEWLADPYCHPIKGNNPKEARNHFFALQAVNSEMLGVLLLDGDDKNASEHDLRAEQLKVLRWRRYEIENYLIHPGALGRFVEKKMGGPIFASPALNELGQILPPAVVNDPAGDHDYMQATPASKSILPGVFSAAGMEIGKMEYYQIAESMLLDEIHPEVTEKLDAIADYFEL